MTQIEHNSAAPPSDRLLARRFLRLRPGDTLVSGIVLALIAVTSGAASLTVIRDGWTADAAGWAQAAGSISAVAGAGWLARSEARRARRRQRERGEEGAWAVRFVVNQARFEAQIIAYELTRAGGVVDVRMVSGWQEQAANAALAINTTLASPVEHIHPAVMLTACNAKVLVDGLIRKLEAIALRVERRTKPDDVLVGDVLGVYRSLEALLEQFDARIRGIRMALDRGHDRLPVNEFAAWSAGHG